MPRTPARDGVGPRLAAALGIGLAVGGAVWGLRAAGALERVDLWLYDRGVAWRAGADAAPPITLVRIREAEIGRHGHPLPDAVLARALERLAAHAPRAIGVDLYRDVPVGDPAGAEALARLAETLPGLVFIEKLPDAKGVGVAAPAFVRHPDALGFNDVMVDADGVLRRGLLMLWDAEGAASFGLGLQLALHYLHADGIALGADPERPEHVRLGPTAIPPFAADDGGYVGADDGGYQVLLDFAAGRDAFATYALDDALAGKIPAAALRDRIVILGTVATSVKDEFRTPLDSDASGIAIHAHVADQLLRWGAGAARPTGVWPGAAETTWLLAWGVLAAVWAGFAPSPRVLLSGVAGAVALLGATSWALFSGGTWLPPAGALLASLGSGGLVLVDVTRRARAERAVVMDLFGRYVSSAVADELWERRDEFMDGNRPRSRRLVITAMLTDLKGYTSAAEKMDPDALMEWINEYMDAMTRVVEEHGGHVDDYTGDGIKANFGVPLASGDAAQDACTAVRCALAMGRALETLDVEWERRGQPTARMRIGLFTGEAVVGNLGSRARMKYTTVGDTVNTAARLESFQKEAFEAEAAGIDGPVWRVLVGGSTWRHLGDDFQGEFLGEHVLRGRGEPIAIHRVYAEREARGAPRGGTA